MVTCLGCYRCWVEWRETALFVFPFFAALKIDVGSSRCKSKLFELNGIAIY